VFSRAAAADRARDSVLDGLQAQFSACAAFYTLELICAKKPEFQSRLALVSKRSDALARAISLAAADAAMRLELNITAGWSFMQSSCSGMPTMESRYSDQCEPLSSASE
jgi:hypothetical protein